MTITLRAHQAATVALLRDTPRHYLNHDCGTGKTITMLAHCVDVPMPTLVLAPKTVMRTAWGGDAQHFPQLRVAFAHGGKAAIADALGKPFDVVVTTFETFRIHHAAFLPCVRRLIVDEASKVKNHKSGVARAVVAFAQRMERVYLLSGTPAPNCPSEWFPQIACVNPHTFGANYWRFINTYFVPRKRTLRDGRQVIDRLDQTPAQRERFTAALAPHVHPIRKAECLDLPPVTDVVVRIDLDADERRTYDTLVDEFRLLLEDGSSSPIKREASLTKMRQAVGGGVYIDGGYVETGRSKVDALEELLEEIGPAEPVVIWAEYRSEIDRLRAVTGGEVLDGRTSHDAESIVRRFQAGEIRRLICHPQAAGHGITLTRSCYAIYFSLSFSRELFDQSRARLDRSGQTRPVTNYILCADRTIDRAIWKTLQNKGDVARAVIEAITARTPMLAD